MDYEILFDELSEKEAANLYKKFIRKVRELLEKSMKLRLFLHDVAVLEGDHVCISRNNVKFYLSPDIETEFHIDNGEVIRNGVRMDDTVMFKFLDNYRGIECELHRGLTMSTMLNDWTGDDGEDADQGRDL